MDVWVICLQSHIDLALRAQETPYGGGPAHPIAGLGFQSSFPRAGQGVVLRSPRILCLAPVGLEPSSPLQSAERREE